MDSRIPLPLEVIVVTCGVKSSRRQTGDFKRCFRAPTILCVVSAVAVFCFVGCSEKRSEGDPKSSPIANNAAAAAAEYALGTTVRFGADGASERYKISGWSTAETGHTWSDKDTAILGFKVQSSERALRLRVTMRGLTKQPELPIQPVEVLANGTTVATWQASDAETQFTAEIPAGTVKSDGVLRLQFNIPKATSPTALGVGKDDRILGISVSALTIE